MDGSMAIPCQRCGHRVLPVDLVPRRDPRVYRQWDGEALLCRSCAAQVDHGLKEVGRR